MKPIDLNDVEFEYEEWHDRLERVIEELGSNGTCDMSFLYSVQEQLEDRGFLTEPQKEAILRVMERFKIED